LSLMHRGDLQGSLDYAHNALAFLDRTGYEGEYGWLPYNRALAYVAMGHALLNLGDSEGAIEAYREALSVPVQAGPPGQIAEVRAGLARAHRLRGEQGAALAQVEEILRYLEHGHLDGTSEPLRITLTCYQVLSAQGDPRAAGVLTQGYRTLIARAEAIDDPALRRSYLENVEANREIVTAYAALGAG